MLRASRELRDEGLVEFRLERGITVTGEPVDGALVTRAKELITFARRHGYHREALIRLIETLS